MKKDSKRRGGGGFDINCILEIKYDNIEILL